MVVYLTNSLGAFTKRKSGVLTFTELDVNEFCNYLKSKLEREDLISAIGHKSTADFIKSVCGVEVPVQRTSIDLKPGDAMLTIKLEERLPEGVVLSEEEIKSLMKEGKVRFYGSVFEEYPLFGLLGVEEAPYLSTSDKLREILKKMVHTELKI